MSNMTMFTGDLKPDLQVTLGDRTKEGVVITDALNVRIIGQRDGVTIFDRQPSSMAVDGLESIVTMEWQPADTQVAGRIRIEVEVTWPGVKPQTFQPSNAIEVRTDFDA